MCHVMMCTQFCVLSLSHVFLRYGIVPGSDQAERSDRQEEGPVCGCGGADVLTAGLQD